MHTCRVCVPTPFGYPELGRCRTQRAWKRTAFDRDSSNTCAGLILRGRADATPWETCNKSGMRKAGQTEVGPKVAQWMRCAPPDAEELFPTRSSFASALAQIAKGASDDPFSKPPVCVSWCGEVNAQNGHAIVRIEQLAPTKEAVVYVNRLVSLCYGAGTFEELVDAEAAPFKTICGNPHCISFLHIRRD
eukprot:TRINITY_DN17151_c1_g2_i2.p1 TRINITY_DN17151_c1_g2~~TRINITY_DN17151_c1_g2_i2.p1  ORF type:complete len:190 (+),score=11.36 TRINITY_DN17151_c1_g2_i2:157-726(+)